jgi:putative addiction module component (TIGR02574 family)
MIFYKGWATLLHARFSRYNQRMTQEAAELLKKALSLPVSERADLADSLIESLDETHDPSVEAAWHEEVQRRMADIDSGKVKPISLEEAHLRLSSSLQ